MLTTLGSILVNSHLPEGLKDHSRVLDKKGVMNIITQVGLHHAKDYGTIVKNLKDLGDKHSTLLGSSFSLADFAPKDVSHIYAQHQTAFNTAQNLKNENDRDNAMRAINIQIEGEINKNVQDDLKKDDNRFLAWGKSGAKGGVPNFRQMLYSSGNQVDVKEELVPHMSKKSFAEGLAPSDFYITSTGARKGVVGSFLSVRDPGAFSKELLASANDLVVTSHDCGTTEGQEYGTHDSAALDRCLARDTGSFKRNDVINSLMQDNLSRQGIHSLVARTPLHCHARDGLCACCEGVLEDGKFSPIGDPIGVRMSQALAEPLTQMALGSKHGGGVLQKAKPAFQKLRQLLHAPENFPDGAVLSIAKGQVQRVEDAPDGGKRVYVNGAMHYVTPKAPVVVKPGDFINRGDMLADGMINPKELVDLKGILAGRQYLSKVMQDTYLENGRAGHPKVFETLARSVINHGLVHDPGDHDYLPEQVVLWNQNEHNTKLQEMNMHPTNAVGWRLKNDVNGVKAGTLIHPDNMDRLGHMKEISVYKNPAEIKPFMVSTEQAALHKNDFLAAMGYRNIKQVLEKAVSNFESVPIHSYSPISSYALGSSFGLGEHGKF